MIECKCEHCIKLRDKGKDFMDREYGRYMIICPDCGNKQCPKAAHHKNQCTNRNELGQGGIGMGAQHKPESIIDGLARRERIKNYAIWQAIHDLESHCRHRTAGQHQDWLQIESEDRASTPVIERALQCLEDAGVEIVRDPNYPNIRIVYDRSRNENFGDHK